MQTFDQPLLKLVEEDQVAYEEAVQAASRPQDFRLMVQSLGLGMNPDNRRPWIPGALSGPWRARVLYWGA